MATYIILEDSGLVIWRLGVLNNGTLQTVVSSGTPVTPKINDPGNTTTWDLGVDTVGNLTTTSDTFDGAQPTSYPLISPNGSTWLLQVSSGGVLFTAQQTIPPVGPPGGQVGSGAIKINCGGSGMPPPPAPQPPCPGMIIPGYAFKSASPPFDKFVPYATPAGGLRLMEARSRGTGAALWQGVDSGFAVVGTKCSPTCCGTCCAECCTGPGIFTGCTPHGCAQTGSPADSGICGSALNDSGYLISGASAPSHSCIDTTGVGFPGCTAGIVCWCSGESTPGNVVSGAPSSFLFEFETISCALSSGAINAVNIYTWDATGLPIFTYHIGPYTVVTNFSPGGPVIAVDCGAVTVFFLAGTYVSPPTIHDYLSPFTVWDRQVWGGSGFVAAIFTICN